MSDDPLSAKRGGMMKMSSMAVCKKLRHSSELVCEVVLMSIAKLSHHDFEASIQNLVSICFTVMAMQYH